MPKPLSQSRQSHPLRVVVLASGNGSNLQAILDTFVESSEVKVVGVASNRRGAKALQRARGFGLPTEVFERRSYEGAVQRDEAMAAWIQSLSADLIVAAGYLAILTPKFVDDFRLKIINIHPSLLPQFRGLNAVQQAFEAGVRKSGVTVHFIDEGVDTGPVIKQKTIKRRRKDDLEMFEKRIHEAEYELLPGVIQEVASGKRRIGAERDLRSFAAPEAIAERMRRSIASTRAALAHFAMAVKVGSRQAPEPTRSATLSRH
ncbi:MAG: phosphoribosylglycinamide formyltransferase [Solirubrobacterales bacterium]